MSLAIEYGWSRFRRIASRDPLVSHRTFSTPEVARENEGKIIDGLRRDIEGGKMPHFSKHLPEVQIYGDMSRHDTQRIRSLLKLSIEGYRTLRILVSRKLAPLMSVAGEEFVKAWLEAVRCTYIIILFRY